MKSQNILDDLKHCFESHHSYAGTSHISNPQRKWNHIEPTRASQNVHVNDTIPVSKSQAPTVHLSALKKVVDHPHLHRQVSPAFSNEICPFYIFLFDSSRSENHCSSATIHLDTQTQGHHGNISNTQLYSKFRWL